jgi:hypothetical protein
VRGVSFRIGSELRDWPDRQSQLGAQVTLGRRCKRICLSRCDGRRGCEKLDQLFAYSWGIGVRDEQPYIVSDFPKRRLLLQV